MLQLVLLKLLLRSRSAVPNGGAIVTCASEKVKAHGRTHNSAHKFCCCRCIAAGGGGGGWELILRMSLVDGLAC